MGNTVMAATMGGAVFIFLLLSQPFAARGKSVLRENGYTDLVVAISPDIPENIEVINQVKSLMTEASRELYIASRNRAYFKQVKILLPKTWTGIPGNQTLEGEAFETSEIRIDRPSPCYGDSPYTEHGPGCGEPGDFMHITPGFLEDSSAYGNWGKVVAHEWAKLRWGVYEEHGYPGDDKFPMFFYKTTWSIEGQKNTLTPNFCLNSGIFGYEQDLQTNGACTYDQETLLPDHNCYYYVTEETPATSSYMSLPYLSNNRQFCDSTEEHIHDMDLPTKQNLYCEGQSTWDVIVKSPDFAEGANQPGNLANTEPEFILVGSAMEPVSYVLVMDVSSSMLPGVNDNKADRAKAMIEEAKRSAKFEIQDGVQLGMVIFSAEDNARPFQDLTLVDEKSRQDMISTLDSVYRKFLGKTCIGCGLHRAAYYPTLLNNGTGQNILLFTDGQQDCKIPSSPACISVADMTDQLVQKKIRVITIALGPDADPEIEDLAIKTGGKSFFVQDNVGSGDINGAFTGSSTFQPGGNITNTNVDIYQKDWDMTNMTLTEPFIDAFDIDMSIGRDVIFQVDITLPRDNSNCTGNTVITWISPNDNHDRFNATFKCNKDNFGVYRHDISSVISPMPTGRWIYAIDAAEPMRVSVSITGKSADASTDPILTTCWISPGSQDIGSQVDLKLAVMADVRQGNRPVIGARVSALVERPGLDADGATYPAIEMELQDTGSGADNIGNDGIYARYFTHYTGKGRYSVKCQVVGNDDTKVNDGFISSKKSIPMKAGTPMCCGSNTINPDSKLTGTGNFSRQSAAGSFQIPIDIDPDLDVTPPMRVLDLTGKMSDDAIILEFTAPGDDLDSVDPAKLFLIKYSESASNLTSGNFNNTVFNTELNIDDLLPGSVMTPPKGGDTVMIQVSRSLFKEEIQYNFALKTQDKADNCSKVSNIARVFLAPPTSASSNMVPSFGIILAFSAMAYLVKTC